jgi:RNA 3'-terminal phosphate cyclase (ATP)
MPTLHERFGIEVERKLVKRGWSAGTLERGTVWFRVRPLGVGQTLRLKDGVPEEYAAKDFEIKSVDVSILAPSEMHKGLQNSIVRELGELLPDAEVCFKIVEDSVKNSRIYVLLVARSETLRWGRDILTSAPKKKKAKEDVAGTVARKVCRDLYEEVDARGTVDEYLQDQLVVFQALAEGRTSFPRSGERHLEEELADLSIGDRMRRDKAAEPFGEGSTHTTTARWVTAQLLPRVDWYNKGRVCQGVGMRMDKAP